ncbi:hypothetical protein FB45DRAFT_1066462 [Roridomyces roridus]|uniref:Uncharacterized protein n=1 Tax=Roridomyces roridus TaxID=1738132 RepID=A0AAD7F951_9AGAR|nr:hypothetical protein FB45DRAFT_1066462 [Roridomyces roridus]
MGLTFVSSWLDLLLVLGAVVGLVQAEYVPLLQPGFFFDYDIASQPVPIPITEQCETIHLTWGRRNAIGPSPVAPYSMVVFTSTLTTPFTIGTGSGLAFDWQVPFAPGTQYQICMWDTNGVPGGCQAMYTVVQNTTVTTPVCQNVTFPERLTVQATVPGGPMSQYGFIDQCTDLTVTPTSGKPPFTLTVAPPLHPPYNITSDSMGPISWTVSLSWSYPFFLSLQSADGQLWSNGPLHAGGFGPNNCLAPGTIPKSQAHAVAAAAGLGAAAGAAILGALATFLYLRPRKQSPRVDAFDTFDQETQAPTRPDSFPTRPRGDTISSEPPWTAATNATAWRASAPNSAAPGRTRTYVLHHDAGQAPVTVFTEADAEVVELPPRYITPAPSQAHTTMPTIQEKGDRLPPLPVEEEGELIASTSVASSFSSATSLLP